MRKMDTHTETSIKPVSILQTKLRDENKPSTTIARRATGMRDKVTIRRCRLILDIR
jgi:hypothetical protein